MEEWHALCCTSSEEVLLHLSFEINSYFSKHDRFVYQATKVEATSHIQPQSNHETYYNCDYRCLGAVAASLFRSAIFCANKWKCVVEESCTNLRIWLPLSREWRQLPILSYNYWEHVTHVSGLEPRKSNGHWCCMWPLSIFYVRFDTRTRGSLRRWIDSSQGKPKFNRELKLPERNFLSVSDLFESDLICFRFWVCIFFPLVGFLLNINRLNFI